LVRPIAEGPDAADRVCATRICENETVAVSINRTSRAALFQLSRNFAEGRGCGSNATCFLPVSNLVPDLEHSLLAEPIFLLYSPNENRTLCCE